MVRGMGLEEWYNIAQGYSAVVHHSPRSNLLEFALGLKRHCTVHSSIVKVYSMSCAEKYIESCKPVFLFLVY
jgi:hypothetical protein